MCLLSASYWPVTMDGGFDVLSSYRDGHLLSHFTDGKAEVRTGPVTLPRPCR